MPVHKLRIVTIPAEGRCLGMPAAFNSAPNGNYLLGLSARPKRGRCLVSRILGAERGARNIRVPVHERAIGIILPRPDVQSVERRQPEAIWSVEQMEKLP